jgi:hypothetical protein
VCAKVRPGMERLAAVRSGKVWEKVRRTKLRFLRTFK